MRITGLLITRSAITRSLDRARAAGSGRNPQAVAWLRRNITSPRTPTSPRSWPRSTASRSRCPGRRRPSRPCPGVSGETVAIRHDLVETVAQSQVASVVFFTLRFQAAMRAWLADVAARGVAGRGGLVVRVVRARVQPVQHPMAARQGRAAGFAPHVIPLRRPDQPSRDRRCNGGRRPYPAHESREQCGHRLAERGEAAAGFEAFGAVRAGRPRRRRLTIRCRLCGRRWASRFER